MLQAIFVAWRNTMKKGVDFTGVTVVFFCHDGQGNFVLAKRSMNCRDEHGCWDCGGGAIEFGDTVEKTLIDEIKQEYCTEVLKAEFLGFRDVHREHDGVPTHWIALDFKVLVDRSKVANGEPHKFDALEWFRLDALPENLHSQFPNFFRLYLDKLGVS
jgi:ADP-ribose pyrophosphatase YjhB (NUDIX family)